jgi:site-specific DNA-methyltransferase (adenine-specific)
MGEPYYSDDLVTIYHGDCRDFAGSADFILTDPPYPAEFSACWSDLATLAVRSLPIGAWCFAYSGQYNLPNAMSRMEQGGLIYRWMIATLHSSQAGVRPIAEMDVLIGWKPILAYRKPPLNGPRVRFADVIAASTRPRTARKTNHPWEQPVDEAAGIIERYGSGTILDPFMGSGTTLVAAKSLNRHAIGIEIEERYCEIAARRCSQGVLGLETA